MTLLPPPLVVPARPPPASHRPPPTTHPPSMRGAAAVVARKSNGSGGSPSAAPHLNPAAHSLSRASPSPSLPSPARTPTAGGLRAVGRLGATRRRAALGGAVVGRHCRGPESPASDASCDDILGFGAFDEGGSASSQVRGQSAGESSPRPTTAPPDESSSTRPESVSPSTGHPTDGPSPPAPLEPLPTSAGLKRGPRASITTCVAIPIQWSSRGLSAWRSRSGGWSGGHFLLGWSPKGGRG